MRSYLLRWGSHHRPLRGPTSRVELPNWLRKEQSASARRNAPDQAHRDRMIDFRLRPLARPLSRNMGCTGPTGNTVAMTPILN